MPDAIALKSIVFFGWTLAELTALLAVFKAQQAAQGLDYVTQASVAGKSASNGQRMNLRDWMKELRGALMELDPGTYGKRRSRTVRAVVTSPFYK